MFRFLVLGALLITGSYANNDRKDINETQAEPGEIPSVVSIQLMDKFHICGGSILDETHILTAAHCVENKKEEELQIQYGSVDRSSTQNMIQVTKIVYHEGFTQNNLSRKAMMPNKLRYWNPYTPQLTIQHFPPHPPLNQYGPHPQYNLYSPYVNNNPYYPYYQYTYNPYYPITYWQPNESTGPEEPIENKPSGENTTSSENIASGKNETSGENPGSGNNSTFGQNEVFGENTTSTENIVSGENIKEERKNVNLPNDIAILTLKTPIKFSNTVKPILLPEKDEATPESENALLAGWGVRETYDELPIRLQRVDLHVFAIKYCEKKYKEKFDAKMQLCSGVPGGGKEQCIGDSGDPLFVGDKQVGIVSWSIKPCANSGNPGVFVRVANFVDWIKDHMKNTTKSERRNCKTRKAEVPKKKNVREKSGRDWFSAEWRTQYEKSDILTTVKPQQTLQIGDWHGALNYAMKMNSNSDQIKNNEEHKKQRKQETCMKHNAKKGGFAGYINKAKENEDCTCDNSNRKILSF